MESSLSKRCCPVNHLWNKRWLNSCAPVQKDTKSVLGMDLDTLQNRHQALLAAGHHHTASARSGKFAKIILRFGIGPDCSTHAQKQPRPRRSKKLRRPAESGKCPAGVLRFSCNSDAFRVELTLSLHTMNFASALVLLTLLCKCLIRLYTVDR